MRMTERRRALIDKATSGGELPAGYRKCKYLQKTSGTLSYIDTGVIPDHYTVVEADILDKEYKNSMGLTSGNTNVNTLRLWFVRGFDGVVVSAFGAYGSHHYFESTPPNHIVFNKEYGKLYINDELYVELDTTQMKTGTIDKTFWIFRVNAETTDVTSMKLATFKMYHRDTKEVYIDLIPCLDSNGVPCMYDKVSKQSFYNAGTDEFLYELEDE